MSSFFTNQRSHITSHDTGLPKEVMSVLPTDPDAQLSLAMRIMSHAYAQRVAELEAEAAALQESLNQRHLTMKSLERKLATYEVEIQELQQKNRQFAEQQQQYESEKGALVETIKRLNREVQRLESFKRNLMQTLHEDESQRHEPSQASVDLSTERIVNDALAMATPNPYHSSSVYSSSRPRPQSPPPLAEMRSAADLKPAAEPRRYPSPPKPTMTMSPTAAATPRLDGKEFFKQARARLSYERFSRFLQIVKELNAGRNSREDTLQHAKELFGVANADLYNMFQNMLSRNMSPQR